MAILKCKMCGGDLNVVGESTVAECEYCGSKQTIPTADDEKKLALFARANKLRFLCEFDKAYSVYESIVSEFPEEAEAYWGLILCKYGIEYVDDPGTGEKVPTCHRSSFDSVMRDENFELVMENADAISLSLYREQAKAIEEIRKRIIEVSNSEEPYDIFICYKETDENGERTLDSVLAQDVYEELVEKGYRVFFSRISLEDKIGQEYEPYIFAALNSAKVMLAFGSKYEYYNAVWVKNEWSRFLKLIASGQKKTLIPCYKNIDAYDMPEEFTRLQAQDMGKVGAIQDLIRGIEKILGKKEKEKETVVVAASGNGGGLTKRGYLYLEDKDFAKAVEYFEKALDENPEDGSAYLGVVLAEAQLRTIDELETLLISLDKFPYYEKAIRFSVGQQQMKLQSILDENRKKITYNRELAQDVVHGDIQKMISLAPAFITVVDRLKESEYEEVLGITKLEVDLARAKYEVFKILENSDVSMSFKDIKTSNDNVLDMRTPLVAKALFELNKAGFVFVEGEKYSYLTEVIRAEKEIEFKKKLEAEMSELLTKKAEIETRIVSLENQPEVSCIEGKRNIELNEKQERLSAIRDEIRLLESQKNIIQNELKYIDEEANKLDSDSLLLAGEINNLSIFQGKRKKELQFKLESTTKQITQIQSDKGNKKREVSCLEQRISTKKSEAMILEIAIMEYDKPIKDYKIELNDLSINKNELERKIADIEERINFGHLKTEVEEDTIYNYIMEKFCLSGSRNEAIKYFREQTGFDVKVSEDIVGSMFTGTYIVGSVAKMGYLEIAVKYFGKQAQEDVMNDYLVKSIKDAYRILEALNVGYTQIIPMTKYLALSSPKVSSSLNRMCECKMVIKNVKGNTTYFNLDPACKYANKEKICIYFLHVFTEKIPYVLFDDLFLHIKEKIHSEITESRLLEIIKSQDFVVVEEQDSVKIIRRVKE